MIAAMLMLVEVAAVADPAADLIECRFAQIGSLSLKNTDAVAVYFPQGMKTGKNGDVQAFDPTYLLSGEVPSDVRVGNDGGLTLISPKGPKHPFIVLSHDATHQGDNFSAAKDDLVNKTDALTRLGFCIRVQGDQAASRRSRIIVEGANFGKKSS